MAQIKKKWEKRSEDNKRRGEMCVLDTIDHLQWRENLLFEIFLNGTINHFDFYKQWLDQTKYIYISFDAFVIAVQSIICCFFFFHFLARSIHFALISIHLTSYGETYSRIYFALWFFNMLIWRLRLFFFFTYT